MTFNFGSSGTLATQIQEGAPADTFASADEANMDKLVSANLVDGEPVVFATNKLVIVTKPDNPKDVKTLADLADLPGRLALRRHRSVREVRGRDPRGRGRHDPREQRDARPGREGDARRRDHGRCRRGDRLRHRRAERRVTRSRR